MIRHIQKVSMATGQPGTSPAGAIGGTPAIPGLCIPALSEEDGPIGVGDGLTGVTQLPAAVALSSSWDASLARQYGAVLGAEEHGKGMEVDYGPTINIQRDPRWGRNFEALTEDPYLNGQLAASEIRGIQSQDVISEVKHFAVYNQETNRNSPEDDAIISNRTMHEIYLPGFYSATKTQSISFADWYSNAPATGGGMVASTLHWNTSSGPGTQPVSVYSTSVPLDVAKTVQSITLPDITPATSANGQLETHIFAAAIANGSATVLAPGAPVQASGATLTWPTQASGEPDNVVAEGQTINLTGSGSNLVVAGSANNGTASGTGTIAYSDGSTQAFTLTMADWYADSPAAGDQLVATTSDWNTPPGSTLGQHAVSVYATAVPLSPGKTVRSVTLPAISHGVGDSLNALHIFAMGIGG